MTQYEAKKVENCFGGSNIYEYRLGIRADERFLEAIGTIGTLKIFRNFPRPFFQTVLADGTTVKGVIADRIIKVNFATSNPAESKQKFEIVLAQLISQLL